MVPGNLSIEDYLLVAKQCLENPGSTSCEMFQTQEEIEANTVVAVSLGCVAIPLNILSIIALFHTKKKHILNYRLMVSLACSDILIGITVVMYLLHNVINVTYKPGYGPTHQRAISRCMFIVIKALNSTGLVTCLFNLIGMAVDHFIAIIYPFQYAKLMSKVKTKLLICMSWVLGVIIGFSDFYYRAHKIPKIMQLNRFNYCESVFVTVYSEEYCVFAITGLAATFLLFIYVRIYMEVKKLQKHENQMFRHSFLRRDSSIHRNVYTHSTKTLFTTLLIVGTFLMCWLPLCICEITLLAYVKLSPNSLDNKVNMLSEINQSLYNLLLVNSIADPIIYIIRMKDIRQGYRKIWRKLCRIKTHKDENLSCSHIDQYIKQKQLLHREANINIMVTEN